MALTLDPEARAYHRTIAIIPVCIFLLGAGIVVVALSYGSRQLLKDGLDWIYDVAFYGIAAIVFGRGARAEQLAAIGAALVLVAASCGISYDIFIKLTDPRPIEPAVIGFSAASAAIEALCVVAALFRFRRTKNPLIEATWLSSRNDAIATTLYVSVQAAARILPIRAPEVALDLFSICLNLQAVYVILRDVRRADRGAAHL